VDIAPWVRDPWRLTSFFLVLGLLLLYIVASETIGFIPLAFIFLLSLFFWLGVRPLSGVIIAAVATLSIHWFFSTMLRVPLPRGLLNTIL
jgi:putative tricarboxylic transport membrane protein